MDGRLKKLEADGNVLGLGPKTTTRNWDSEIELRVGGELSHDC
jgi:hypothetical protein